MCSTYPMMLLVALGGGSLQVICKVLVERGVALSPSGAGGRSWTWATARRALAWLVPALFSAMHW